jgi:serine/threonine protein kinase
MPTDTRLADLLLTWEEARDAGRPVTPEELCKDCPELLDELRGRVEALEAMRSVLQTVPVSDAAVATAPGETLPHIRTSAAVPQIPGYEIVSELGRGGMGTVYKARQIALNRVVALKVLSGGPRAGSDAQVRFRTEGQAVAQLQHPNIVQIYDLGEERGVPYFALEYVDGGSLDRLIERGTWPRGTAPAARAAAELVRTLARAMHYAHERGIVHRDLKPSNILLPAVGGPRTVVSDERPSGSLTTDHWPLITAKIADFGLARQLERDTRLTRTGSVLGTPCYMAPEQARGDTKNIGPRTDIYGLGAILYELLSGEPPFSGGSELEVLKRVESERPSPPSARNPACPRALETICLKCLEKDPADRYPSAAALADDLGRFLEGTRVQARPRSWRARLLRGLRRPRNALALLGALALLIAGVAAGFLLRPTEQEAPEPSEQEVRRAAAEARELLLTRLLASRLPDGWIPRDPDPGDVPDAEQREVWTHSAAVWAFLRSPELTDEAAATLVPALNIPFAAGLPIERNGTKYGWATHPVPGGNNPTSPPIAYTAAALSAALARPGLLAGEERQRQERHLRYVQEAMRAYQVAPFRGGWAIFPNQRVPEDGDVYASCVALLALLEARLAGQPWEGSIERRDELLRLTAGWLAERFEATADPPGWRPSRGRAIPVNDGLTLRCFATLLRAEAEAGVPVPANIREAIPAHLLRCGNRDTEFPDMSGVVSYTFTDLDGLEQNRKETFPCLWYPWALESLKLWLARPDVPEEARTRLRRARASLAVDFAMPMAKRGLDTWTVDAVIVLYGLGAIER